MTLTTEVYILDKIDPAEVFRYAQSLLTPFDDEKRTPEQQKSIIRQDKTYQDGTWAVREDSPWSMDNAPGQGLPAWLMMAYRPDAPLRTQEQADVCDEDICDNDPNCDRTIGHDPACWIQLSFDTTYGYSGPNGVDCGGLHAILVGLLGKWLTEKGVLWAWQNEFTGEIHDDPVKLLELRGSGADAREWFNITVLPLIQEMSKQSPHPLVISE